MKQSGISILAASILAALILAGWLAATGLVMATGASAETGAAVQPPAIDFEEMTLENTDDIVTEEETALNTMNYKAPPETVETEPLVTFGQLQYASEIDLNRALAAVEEALNKCIDMRTAIESRIGQRPGVWNVNRLWVRAYNNCILQAHTDARTIGRAISERRMQIIASGEDEGATLLTGMVDRLMTRHSQVKRAIASEMDMAPLFIDYFNTGVRNY